MSRFLDLLSKRTDAEEFEPGEPIFHENEPGAIAFCLLEGEVALERGGAALRSVQPGELFGEDALIGDTRREVTARATTAARVAPISLPLFELLKREDPSLEWTMRARRRRFLRSLASIVAISCWAAASPLAAQVWESRSALMTPKTPYAEGDAWGVVLAVGDFDGDGHDDLAIGSNSAGSVEIYRGGANGLGATPWKTFASAQAGCRFAASLAAGDFDGDGRDELAIGAPGYDYSAPTALVDAGRVFIEQFESGSWTGEQQFYQDTDGIPGGAESYDLFGAALTAGDFDGDGFDDLAIGVPWEAIGAVSYAGAVNVLYGTAGGLTATGAQIWYRSGGGIDGTAAFANLGHTLAAGDFDGDGYDDLAIGAPYSAIDSVSSTGEVVILFGGSAPGLGATGQQRFDPTDLGRAAQGQNFGSALAAADFDHPNSCEQFGQCADDLAVGAPAEGVAVLGGTATYAGRAYVVHGSRNLGGLDLASFQGLDQWAFFNVTGAVPENPDRFGFALAAGELDGRRGADLVVGSPFESSNGVAAAGCADLLFGGGATFDGNLEQHLETLSGYASAPAAVGDEFGGAFAIGDFDGNGTGDLAIDLVDRAVGVTSEVGSVLVLYGALFADDFESISTNHWSSAQP